MGTQKKWKLVQRSCKCGCGLAFKVKTGSPQLYASCFHDPNYKETLYGQDRIRQVRKWLSRLYGDHVPASIDEIPES